MSSGRGKGDIHLFRAILQCKRAWASEVRSEKPRGPRHKLECPLFLPREVGCQFPQFPFIAHSRGGSAENMERSVDYARRSTELREGAQALVTRAVDMATLMVDGQVLDRKLARGGRKAHELDVKAQI